MPEGGSIPCAFLKEYWKESHLSRPLSSCIGRAVENPEAASISPGAKGAGSGPRSHYRHAITQRQSDAGQSLHQAQARKLQVLEFGILRRCAWLLRFHPYAKIFCAKRDSVSAKLPDPAAPLPTRKAALNNLGAESEIETPGCIRYFLGTGFRVACIQAWPPVSLMPPSRLSSPRDRVAGRRESW